jgi:hypothetical protein
MVPDQKKMPIDQSGKDEQSASFKAFVEGAGGAEHPERNEQKATGTNNYMDQQNKMIDQHNLRK